MRRTARARRKRCADLLLHGESRVPARRSARRANHVVRGANDPREGAFSPISPSHAARRYVRRAPTMSVAVTRGLQPMWPGELAQLAFSMWHRFTVFQLWHKRGRVGMPHFDRPMKQWDRWVKAENARSVRAIRAKGMFFPALRRRIFAQWPRTTSTSPPLWQSSRRRRASQILPVLTRRRRK
jgi:hypothetical protein